ncbi:MAG TPA: iron-sulfur cluster insertion protein ErpA [Gaiellales bacterium]|nr:iron-sulfur cluster insertion protein ErpA [Gaiellales bacterium]
MVTITERAAAKVKDLLAAEADPSLTALRVAIEGGGCSGFQYALGFDGDPDDGDSVADCHGVRILVDRFSLPYLEGADVDYVDGLMGAGFQIRNPNVEAACGCGSSFQAKAEAAPDLPQADDCGDDCGCAH